MVCFENIIHFFADPSLHLKFINREKLVQRLISPCCSCEVELILLEKLCLHADCIQTVPIILLHLFQNHLFFVKRSLFRAVNALGMAPTVDMCLFFPAILADFYHKANSSKDDGQSHEDAHSQHRHDFEDLICEHPMEVAAAETPDYKAKQHDQVDYLSCIMYIVPIGLTLQKPDKKCNYQQEFDLDSKGDGFGIAQMNIKCHQHGESEIYGYILGGGIRYVRVASSHSLYEKESPLVKIDQGYEDMQKYLHVSIGPFIQSSSFEEKSSGKWKPNAAIYESADPVEDLHSSLSREPVGTCDPREADDERRAKGN